MKTNSVVKRMLKIEDLPFWMSLVQKPSKHSFMVFADRLMTGDDRAPIA